MIDLHTHLYFPEYDGDRDETIARAFSAGITRMISVGTEPSDWEKALSITQFDERIFAAVGLHPHWFDAQYTSCKNETEANRALAQALAKMRELVRSNAKIAAIGECGLDYFTRDGSVLSAAHKHWQKIGFEAQLALAQEIDLPMILHTRPSAGSQDAYEDMLEVLSLLKWRDMRLILHCYVGDTETTKQFLMLSNVFFSFTGVITYSVKKTLAGTKNDISETITLIPIERMFAETDCPFLAPQGRRGQRNEPIFVSETIEKLAETKQCSVESLEAAMRKNLKDILP